jgi:membrane protease YdiL (CAAX protease family)
MNLRTIRVIFWKDLIEIARNRRAIMVGLVLPLLLYPVLMMALPQFLDYYGMSGKRIPFKVAVIPKDDSQLTQWITQIKNVEIQEEEDPTAALREWRIDAIVTADTASADVVEGARSANITVRFDSMRIKSMRARNALREGLEGLSQSLLEQRAAKAGYAPEAVKPISVRMEDLTSGTQMRAHYIGGALAVLAFILVLFGAYGPAIDLFAGARGRSAFESLLSTPVGKFDIVCGKFLALFSATLAMFYIGAPLQGWRLHLGLLISEWGLIMGAPIALLWYLRVGVRSTLQLRLPPWRFWIAGPILITGARILVVYVCVLQSYIVPTPQSAEDGLVTFMTAHSFRELATLLFLIAVSAGVCEETLFRGVIQSGLRTRLSTAGAILVTGILFGCFHVNLGTILPAALLGIANGYVVARGRSIFPGMLMHALNNAIPVLAFAGVLPEEIARLLAFHGLNLLLGIVLILVGVLIIEYRRPNRKSMFSVLPRGIRSVLQVNRP